MKIVIDISEYKYKSICEGIEASERCGVVGIDPVVHKAIANGILLPKGHGRLIDGDALYKDFEEQNFIYEADSMITPAPTIIEADTVETEIEAVAENAKTEVHGDLLQ